MIKERLANPERTVRDTNYTIQFEDEDMVIAQNGGDGVAEVFAKRPGGCSGWHLIMPDGTALEFVREATFEDIEQIQD